MIESLKEDSANFLKEKDRKSGGANYAYRHKGTYMNLMFNTVAD